jgi:hypothetical protein
MRGMVAPVMVLLLALLHAPPQAQALFSDFLPSDLLQLGASEPVTLLLTAVALLSLARVGTSIGRGTASDLSEPAAPVAQPDLRRQHTPASSKRAA